MLWAGWAVSALAASIASGTLALFAGVFLKPHAFGGRDGQGAAGLAALVVLVAGGALLVLWPLALFLGVKLRASGVSFPLWTSAAVPALAGAALLAFGRFS